MFLNSHPGARLWGNEKVLNRMREEYLADNFANFMVYKDAKYKEKSKLGKLVSKVFDSIFGKLRSFIQWFKGNPSSLDTLFDVISSGYYKNRALQETGDDTYFKLMPGLLSKESNEVVGSVMLTFLKTQNHPSNKGKKKEVLVQLSTA